MYCKYCTVHVLCSLSNVLTQTADFDYSQKYVKSAKRMNPHEGQGTMQ
jgi:hypothetical protein